MDIAITKMNSKGQVVIPAEMRKEISEGEKLIIIKNRDQLIMKKASQMDKNLEEYLDFAKKAEEALKRYEKGGFIEMSKEDFIKEIEKFK